MEATLLACDWGATNLRAWMLDGDGAVLARRAFPLGVSTLAPGEAPRRFTTEVRPALGAEGLPAILCRAIGSNLGWATVPYADCPAEVADLAGRLAPVADDTAFDEGLAAAGPWRRLLIGAEVAAAPSLLGLTPSEVALIGDPALCARYQRALRRAGVDAAIFDGEAAAIAGLWVLSPK